jgi:hypothetical protein
VPSHVTVCPAHGSGVHLMVPPSQSGAGSFTPRAMHTQVVPQFSACVLQSVAVVHWPVPPEPLPLPLELPLLLPVPPLLLPLPPPDEEPLPLLADASCPKPVEGAELLLHAETTARSGPTTRSAFTHLS